MKKREIPQIIPETGMSSDYFGNELGIPVMNAKGEGRAGNKATDAVASLVNSIREFPIPGYCAKYPREKYNVPTALDQVIVQVDSIAAQINALALLDPTKEQETILRIFWEAMTEMNRLFYGDSEQLCTSRIEGDIVVHD